MRHLLTKRPVGQHRVDAPAMRSMSPARQLVIDALLKDGYEFEGTLHAVHNPQHAAFLAAAGLVKLPD